MRIKLWSDYLQQREIDIDPEAILVSPSLIFPPIWSAVQAHKCHKTIFN